MKNKELICFGILVGVGLGLAVIIKNIKVPPPAPPELIASGVLERYEYVDGERHHTSYYKGIPHEKVRSDPHTIVHFNDGRHFILSGRRDCAFAKGENISIYENWHGKRTVEKSV